MSDEEPGDLTDPPLVTGDASSKLRALVASVMSTLGRVSRRTLHFARRDHRGQFASLVALSLGLLGIAALIPYPVSSATLTLQTKRAQISVVRDTTLPLDSLKISDLVVAGLSRVQYDGVERNASRVFVDDDAQRGTPHLRYLDLRAGASLSVATTEQGYLHIASDRQHPIALTAVYDGSLVRSSEDESEPFEARGVIVLTADDEPLEIFAKPSQERATLSFSDLSIERPRFVDVEHRMVGGRLVAYEESALLGGSITVEGIDDPVVLKDGDRLRLGRATGNLQRLVAHGSALTLTMKLQPELLQAEREDELRDLRPSVLDRCSTKRVVGAWTAVMALLPILQKFATWWRKGGK